MKKRLVGGVIAAGLVTVFGCQDRQREEQAAMSEEQQELQEARQGYQEEVQDIRESAREDVAEQREELAQERQDQGTMQERQELAQERQDLEAVERELQEGAPAAGVMGEEQTVAGIVEEHGADSLTVRDEQGQRLELTLEETTFYEREGRPAQQDALQEGAQVRASYRKEGEEMKATRIEIQGEGMQQQDPQQQLQQEEQQEEQQMR